uniref:TLC domain-containing protein n=1 Tax=Strombidium rassoulzadegani TaxID=1082188 RepID=A0A7S3CLY2_9SPIT|mmetsp:Transcript_16481/g.27985  ORF Transcript_16481/g.27985 Transcript_16481/m.27985 type:complete len:352 (+) Transcript_16481:38-1093(+)|eukprot:CAMPEP_0168622548 /NCGR_PEP_ID=MMETSP0449_2-20121227/8329_1 /TAXON_ID=1082188 /ORGANISM="Strombidium rassoulzadegani, Strain ras09" /LENGTH=351 /DNA_ID=CAMNT_0008663827 /DNA_START=14 /DNA_END=1069 /DNA_ORIENTATION=+
MPDGQQLISYFIGDKGLFTFGESLDANGTDFKHFRGDSRVFEQLPERFKSGSVFLEEGDLTTYATWYISSFLFFVFAFFFYKALFETVEFARYIEKKGNERNCFITTWTANTHHFIINYLVICSLLAPQCDLSTPFKFSYDEVCFFTVDTNGVRNIMFTCGYLTYDFFVLNIFHNLTDKTTRQMVWHHVVAVSGLFAAVYVGFSMSNIGNMALTCEVSTIFLNYRSMYKKEELNLPVPLVNQIIFFITFTIFRVINFPLVVLYQAYSVYMLFGKVDSLQKICLLLQFAQFIWMTWLNFHWYSLILKGLKKLLQANGLLAADPPKDKKTEDEHKKNQLKDKLIESEAKEGPK